MNFRQVEYNIRFWTSFIIVIIIFSFIHDFWNVEQQSLEQKNVDYTEVTGSTYYVLPKTSSNLNDTSPPDTHMSSNDTSQTELSNIQVIPGGQSIGIQLETLGILVVGHHKITQEQKMFSPAHEANIQVGDLILKIENEKIESVEDIKPYIEQAGKNKAPLSLTLKRGEKIITTSVLPVKDEEKNNYSIGLYIRDSAAGIGTLSFYEPKTKKYGALGHVISDIDTKQPIPIHTGKIIHSEITNIHKASRKNPGEKQAKFSIHDQALGTVNKNSPYGVFGILEQLPKEDEMHKAMDVGFSKDVQEGPAKILTVVENEKVEEYDIEIVNNKIQSNPSTKGMVIKVTDEKLIQQTGGIIQGMSGSPIIQNDKIIGAVTHVFVNDPTTGYGVHIEWMLQEAGILTQGSELKAS